jgi:Membrane bound O-acyl transferase family
MASQAVRYKADVGGDRGRGDLIGLPPLVLLPAGAWLLVHPAPAWMLMWALSIAVYAGLKWLTWWRARRLAVANPATRSLGYLLAWPGMDAPAFLDAVRRGAAPSLLELAAAAGSLALGATLFWGVARLAAAVPLAAGWIGLFGLIFVLHFGGFRLASIFWRTLGVDAVPLMRAPILAGSLGELWGRRWNTAFHVLARDLLVAPLRSRVGMPAAVLAAFLASGLVHDLVLSVPAGAGYGLPTAYFLLQGAGLLAERTRLGRRLGLGAGLRGRLFALAVAGVPAFGLFHPPFVVGVIVPFMRAVGAL